ncbi:MAG TPA: ketoacyl-ACP synthase III [Pseudoclavibacter sp.]|nr:ketoacyl-ACP synthase III [Pseudoclavibacter sp.]
MSTPLIREAHGTAHSRILALGAARGDRDVPNAELIEPINSSDEWIQQRTGIISRKRASEDVTATDLAIAAAREAISSAGIAPELIDMVVVSTISAPSRTPSMAVVVADQVGANPAAAYDISAACAGYTYAIAQADAAIRSGLAHYVLVVGAEKLSDFVDPADRSISFLLGDGAGAAVLGPSDVPGVSETVWGSDGSRHDTIRFTHSELDFRKHGGDVPTLRQEGPSVFRWAVWDMAKVAQRALDVAGVSSSDLAAFIPHQANARIIDEFAKQLKLPESVRIAHDIAHTGNTSAASIPLATHALLAEHPELSGGLALQIGFGAGLVYGAQVVLLP